MKTKPAENRNLFFIRADANREIGAGHIMRCAAIARALEALGQKACFITADRRGEHIICEQGFTSLCLDSDWKNMGSETESIERLIEEYRPDILLLDSYQATDDYVRFLKKFTRVAHMDDEGNVFPAVDAVINYNVFSEELDYTAYSQKGTKLLLSPRYAPLRDEFCQTTDRTVSERPKQVLLLTGGADPQGITERIIESLIRRDFFEGLSLHVVVGSLNSRIERIVRLAEEEDSVVLHINERDMAGLMLDSDIAISTAGSTLYELCACGTPTIAFATADNQLPAVRAFRNLRIMESAGDCREEDAFLRSLEQSLQALLTDSARRSDMSQRMRSLVDGRGAQRVATELIALANQDTF